MINTWSKKFMGCIMRRKKNKVSGRFVLISSSYSKWNAAKNSWVVGRKLEKIFIEWGEDINKRIKECLEFSNSIDYHNGNLKKIDKILWFYYFVIRDGV